MLFLKPSPFSRGLAALTFGRHVESLRVSSPAEFILAWRELVSTVSILWWIQLAGPVRKSPRCPMCSAWKLFYRTRVEEGAFPGPVVVNARPPPCRSNCYKEEQLWCSQPVEASAHTYTVFLSICLRTKTNKPSDVTSLTR